MVFGALDLDHNLYNFAGTPKFTVFRYERLRPFLEGMVVV